LLYTIYSSSYGNQIQDKQISFSLAGYALIGFRPGAETCVDGQKLYHLLVHTSMQVVSDCS